MQSHYASGVVCHSSAMDSRRENISICESITARCAATFCSLSP
ncbi:Uncharacterised protein [Vibrio cholerae]|uniref:Uncharacterized protein n=1 Tax=Vibrio cholerae TaxID=666 RepID=A0A655WY73_VIBCL|nr:Uncharacterised protein [Vibrio cholerae]